MRGLICSCIVLLCLAAETNGHFLWLVVHPEGKPGEVQAYFSETATPDDPEFLKKFDGLTAVALTKSRGETKRHDIELKAADSALVGKLPADVQSPLVAEKTYGVVTRGGEAFLLKYSAKAYPSSLPGSWSAINDKELAAFEITPKIDGDEIVLKVTWQGEPVAGDQVTIEGPGLAEKLQGDTNDQGQFRCKLPESGLFSVRARHTEKTAGKLGEDSYAAIRHYATLALPFSAPEVTAVTHDMPNLPRGVTSFGATVAGDAVYIYGGHFGDAHHYSSVGQSSEFWRLSLKADKPTWETLPSGPRLTGLAMVSHAGKLYRLGGFTARNGEKEDQDLWSQDGFAMFDPVTGKWADLPALPEPRSSHDAAVLDGKLYLAGGWNMAGAKETTWHDTAWVCDLTQNKLSWLPLPKPPFHRRALSLAAYDGKLYVLGGMQESGKPTTQVDIYDPATQSWSLGTPLIGGGMEGFGNSSFAWNGHLVATTMSGSVQQLDGAQWDIIGQLTHPRFFHRQLVSPTGNLLILGGASMQTGKTNSVEVLQAAAK